MVPTWASTATTPAPTLGPVRIVTGSGGDRYVARVDAVMDHVRLNLAADLSLAELAPVAHFSPYHFHRIFKGVTGETVAQFTRRARLERAVDLMRAAPHRHLGSIGVEVGFATPSEFSRVFRSVYGLAPSAWDRRSALPVAGGPAPTPAVPDGPPGERDDPGDPGGRLDDPGEPGERLDHPDDPDEPARLVRHDPARLATIRVRDPWTGGHLAAGYRRLQGWFERQGLDWRAQRLIGLSWESAVVSPPGGLVYDLGLTLPDSFDATGLDGDPVGIHHLPGGPAVDLRCRGLPAIARGWEHLYRRWLPPSGYEPADRPALKRFRRTPERLGPDAWDVDCSIALRRAGAP